MRSLETASDGHSPSPVEVVTNTALGYLLSRSLHVAAELGIADLLTDEPKSVATLAARTGAHPLSLQRLLRTLAAQGIFKEEPDGRFATTPAATLLQQNMMRDGVLLCGEVSGDGSWWNAVGALRHSVMTGAPAFNRQHGMGFFDYLANHPNCRDWFDRGMANFATAENPAIAAAYDFSRTAHVIDIGGGQGGLLAEILKLHQNVQATLFDLPSVIRNPICLNDARFTDRWGVAGGDFFRAVPAGADVYVLKRILHDWSDEQALRILRCCRQAMHAQARLLVVDAVLPPGNAAHPGKVMDILMMVFAEGRERTEQEFAALFEKAGLQLSSVTPTASTLSIVEAEVMALR